jgi:ATP-binding cassette subfamily B protein
MLRPDVRLVILDEPFRGLDFEQRSVLLSRAREHWKDATLLSISHHIAETRSFERVLVIDEGRVVEDGNPRQLALYEGSRFCAMLKAERMVTDGLWASAEWRHLKLERGELIAR